MKFNNWQNAIVRSDWSDEEKKLFTKFAEDAERHQIGERRIEKYRAICASARNMSGCSLLEITKNIKTFGNLCAKINASTKYMPQTKQHLKLIMGSLYNFIHNSDRSLKYADRELKELVAHKIKAADKRMARAVITREELRDLSKHANNTMDKALIWLLFESGMRCGEFEQLRKTDIQEIDEGLVVRVPAGKTGERQCIVVEAAKFVNAWLDAHPAKEKDAPLWQSSQSSRPLTQPAISKRLRCIASRLNDYRKKQGIPLFVKDVNPHNFRHSRASELGGEAGMTEAILCKFFGWELGSAMPRVYLHLTDEQVRKAVLRTYGKAKPDEEKEIITHWVCSRCKDNTPMEKNFCGRCGASRDGKIISLTEKMRQELEATRSELKAMKKNQATRDQEMENLSRKLAAFTVGQTKRGTKAAIGDKG